MAKIPAPGSAEEASAARARVNKYGRDTTARGFNEYLYRDRISTGPDPDKMVKAAASPTKMGAGPVGGRGGGGAASRGPLAKPVVPPGRGGGGAAGRVVTPKPAPKPAAPAPRAAPRAAAKPDLLTSLRKDKAFMESIAPKPAAKAAPKATPKAPATKRKSDYDNFMGN